MFLLAQHPNDTEHSGLVPAHRKNHLQTMSQAVSRDFQCFWTWLVILPLAFLILCKAFCAEAVETRLILTKPFLPWLLAVRPVGKTSVCRVYVVIETL